MNRSGLVAIENAGYTQSDGYEDILSELEQKADSKFYSGYCFYHGQDLDRSVGNHGLYLSFGPLDATQEEKQGPEIGRKIVAILAENGFQTKWDGTFNNRIFIPVLDWKRR